jgi:hypothetical protein
MEGVAAEFAGKPVRFFIIYTQEAHPDRFGLKQPETWEERKKLAERTRTELGILGPAILIDAMDNQATLAYRGFPNKIYVINQGGRVVYARRWADGQRLRDFLTEALK